MLSRVAAVIVVLVFSSPAWAGLVERYFPEKTEAQVAADFEADLPEFLTARLKDTAVHLRMYAPVAKNTEVFAQLTAVDATQSTWTTLVNSGWYKATPTVPSGYAMEPYGKEYKFEHAKLPPAEVAAWFNPKVRMPAEVVACACWLAGRGEMWLANGEVAALATVEELKADVETWVSAKNGWSGTLESIETFDAKHAEAGALLVSKEGKAAWFKRLDDEAKDAFKALEKLQGNDAKSKPGMRKNSPGMRLELLQNYVGYFEKAYAGTPHMQKKAKDLAAISEAIKADLEWIETEKYKAERKGIDGDWAGASRHYEQLQRADPYNPDLLQFTAVAFYNAAKVTDGGRKSEDPAAAKKAAQMYELLLEVYPTQLGYRNHAGLNWLAGGDKGRAKEHHQEVIRRTDGKKELTDSEKSNREYAEKQLELIK